VKGAKDFAEEFTDVVDHIEPKNRPDGLFLTDYVSGEMKAGDRKEKIDKLKALDGYERGILTNARCLAEGVDVPSLDGVAFIDPKGSQVEIIQAVGRAIRKVRGAAVQKKGTIVLPVFIEEGDDPATVIEASNFKPVWDVLKALRAHDEVLADTLDQYRTNMAKNASQNRERISAKVIFDMPTSVGVEFSAALRTVIVEATTAPWEFWYGLLENFKVREGHCLAQRGHLEFDFNLGNWISKQRHNKERLSSDRIKRLETIGFSWDPFSEQWEKGFNSLKSFQKSEGHCMVARNHIEDGFNLGLWTRRQRQNVDQLSKERVKMLDALGFSWDPFFEQWEKGYSVLKKYYSREGHSFVPTKHNEEGFNLGGWVDTQRTNKRSLSKNNLDRLNALGFIWNALDENWEVGFRALQNFYDREGHSNVPQNLEEDGFRLGTWLNTQRAKKDILSTDRHDKLEKLELSWRPKDQKWEKGFSFLKKFHSREGHCFVPQRHLEDGYNLRAWVDNQRNTNAVQSEDRLNRLKALGFTWNTFDQRWDEGYTHLQNYHDREGHSRVAKNHIESGFNLGLWVSSQRSNKATQTSARAKKLQSLGFVWDAVDEKWEEGFRALQKFYDREGHCLVPNGYEVDGKKLAKWVSHQRTSIDTITEDRFNRLQALGFSWDPLKDKWEEGFRALQKFHGRKGHCLVPKLYTEGSYNLGNWVNKQRSKKLSLQQDRKTLLDELGFSWNTKEEKK
jgi:hypothetical protein